MMRMQQSNSEENEADDRSMENEYTISELSFEDQIMKIEPRLYDSDITLREQLEISNIIFVFFYWNIFNLMSKI